MKTLYLIRHAKSDWGHDGLPDIDRPLNERGYKDAHTMSLLLKQKKLLPDGIVSSPAIRAMSTALIFCRNFEMDPKNIRIERNLYDTSASDYMNVIAETENNLSSIALFAHNPIISNLASHFIPDIKEEMPTCGIVGISFNTKEWKHILALSGKLLFFETPKKQAEG